MKLDYHPPHLILNHFPSALFPVEFAFAAIGFYRQHFTFSYAAFYVLLAGVLLGWLAVAGFIFCWYSHWVKRRTGQSETNK